MTRFKTTATPPASLQTGDLFVFYPDLFRLDSVIGFVHAVSPVLTAATHVVLAQRMGTDGVWQPERWAFLVDGSGLNLVTGIDRDALGVESPTAVVPVVQRVTRECTDPDCDPAQYPTCDGDHEPLRCPTTRTLLGKVATANGRYLCCGGLYPDHAADIPAAA